MRVIRPPKPEGTTQGGADQAPAYVFDPEKCPLLAGLNQKEQLERMKHDPIIRACAERVQGGRIVQPSRCGAAIGGKVAKAFLSKKGKAEKRKDEETERG